MPQFTKTPSRDDTKSFEKIPSREDIKKVLPHVDLKHKAIILLMSSSGMGSAEVRNLRYKDFLKAMLEYLDPKKELFAKYVITEEDIKVDEDTADIIFDVLSITKKLRKKGNIIPTWRIKRTKQECIT